MEWLSIWVFVNETVSVFVHWFWDWLLLLMVFLGQNCIGSLLNWFGFSFKCVLLYCFFVSLLGIFWGGLKFFNNISKLRTKGFLKDIVALINPTFQFIYMHGYTMGRHILIENIWFLLLQVNSEMIRENLERIVGSDDSTFSGLDLATLIRNKYGRSYDVLLIKKVWFSICDAYL